MRRTLGPQGEKGELGPTGPPGPTGEKGPRGKHGKRVSFSEVLRLTIDHEYPAKVLLGDPDSTVQPTHDNLASVLSIVAADSRPTYNPPATFILGPLKAPCPFPSFCCLAREKHDHSCLHACR